MGGFRNTALLKWPGQKKTSLTKAIDAEFFIYLYVDSSVSIFGAESSSI